MPRRAEAAEGLLTAPARVATKGAVPRRRTTALIVSLLACGLGGGLWALVALVQHDRAELVSQFARDREQQLERAVLAVSDAIDDVFDDVRLAAELLSNRTDEPQRRRELEALLEAIGQYRAIGVYDAAGAESAVLFDRRATGSKTLAELKPALRETAAEALAAPPGQVVSSKALPRGSGWLRVFATRFDDPAGKPGGVVAVLVDVAPLLAPLDVVVKDGNSRLLVLGPHGRPFPSSDARLSGLSETLLAPSGPRLIDAAAAASLGLPASEAVALRLTVPLEGAQPWSVLSVTTTEPLRAHDRALVARLVVVSALLACLFGLLGGALVLAARRKRELEESRRHLAELRALEGQLVRAEKLATVGVLAAGIAHEVGTPLGVVRGRAELARGKLGRDHPQAASLDVVIEQADRVSRTIRELLDFARPQATCTRAVSVEAVLRAVSSLLEVEADRRRRRLVVGPVPDALVEADEHQLHQVLVNLVLNGFDACDERGTVKVSAAVDASGRCTIEVADDGAGIPEDQLPRIFDPFWTTKDRGQGTGLGLAVVDKVVRSHGASIEVTSREGAGTTFTLRWPLHGPPAARGTA